MDIYTQKSKWKWYLAIAGVLILLLTMGFTSYLSRQLAEEERKKAELWVLALQKINAAFSTTTEFCECEDLTIHGRVNENNSTIPVILYDPDLDTIVSARNFGLEQDDDPIFLKKELEKMRQSGANRVELGEQQLYYKQSTILTLLQYFPFFQMLLIGAFIAFGYFTFSSARRGEQNRVWAGMAKETAHQLGTPISAMLGWIDHLKLIREEDEEIHEVADELRNDVARLELVADRFSKIGSAPELKPVDIYEELENCRAYMQRRAPRRVQFKFPEPNECPPLLVNINSHLFVWVVENLLRNALDAMGGKGEIGAKVYEGSNFVGIDIWDTGKGIPSNKWKKVFQPGFSTKKRGWGLGLSLAKRIIEEYHAGKIFVKDSKEGL
ncbi:MAG: HAMP domain-containing sensor histidine kinase, partial [Bacteroidota bacterium]